MSKEIRYPTVHTVYRYELPMHPIVEIRWAEGQEPLAVCGDSWCSGGCGLSALVIPATDKQREYKIHSNMVAVGHLAQGFHTEWKGTRIEVPSEHRMDFLQRIWW